MTVLTNNIRVTASTAFKAATRGLASSPDSRPPLPPFSYEQAIEKKELEYRLIKEIWVHSKNRIAVRFAYEYHNDRNEWFRAYGNENWEFDENGLMQKRYASINDVPISNKERLFHWDRSAPRPNDHPGLTALSL